MEQGIIFTKDKKDIEVFFLKPQQPKPLIDDSIGADNKDCYNDDSHLTSELLQETDFLPPMEGNPHNLPWAAFNEQDVNENSAGGGAHEYHTISGADFGPCPVGHKGETGWKGHDSLYDAIFDTIKRFENSQLNIASETAQQILAMSIEGDVKHFYDKK
jgi:hypothetical protein